METLYKPIPEGQKRGWKGVDLTTGQEVTLPPLFAMVQDYLGMKIVYGSAGAYDAPYIEEQGGPVVLGFYIHKGEIFVTVLKQNRPLMGGVVKNAVRGMKRQDEDPKLAALREQGEEITGLNNVDPEKMPGEDVNVNSALFNTVTGGGVSYWAFELTPDVLEVGDDDIRFKKDVKAQSSTVETMMGCELISIWDALTLPCGMTVNAAARLIAYLKEKDQLKLVVS
ncbi:hypothetical protein KKH43_02645 [Patescibacteria group bacterium]|nr:hypothetical protein [Patescibacteria group bacterium]